MPILDKEADIFPDDLFSRLAPTATQGWYALYTMARREKELMRRLRQREQFFYSPTIRKDSVSPTGRRRHSFLPLFPMYVFLFGDRDTVHDAMTTNCVSRWLPAPDFESLTNDLRQIHQLLATGAPVTPEEKLAPGDRVRIRSGVFKDFEGTIVRHGKTQRLVVAVNFLQKGASVELDDCRLEKL